MSSIQKVAHNDGDPNESTEKLHLIYSEFGTVNVEIYARSAKTYQGKQHITKLEENLKVNFFANNGKIVSSLTALYGEIDHDKGMLFVSDSVRLKNFARNQTLQTEKLIWNQKDSTIYSVSQVIVKTPKGNLYGSGIKTKQDFSLYEILKPRGRILLEKELKFDEL